jgi:hypothetical protein
MELLARIKKLLALAESSNENEAALAAARAQELLDLHKLSSGEVDAKLFDAENPVDESELTEDFGRYRIGWVSWKCKLLHHIARLNGCTLLYGYSSCYKDGKIWTNPKFQIKHTRRITIIGRESDRQIVEYLSAYLSREIERLAKVAFEEKHGTGNYRELPNWTVSFGYGATHTIAQRMRRERVQSTNASPGMQALVLRDDQALEDWLKGHYPSLSSSRQQSNARLNNESYARGGEAGRQMEWHSAVRGGNKQTRLLTGA